ncbi:hypothetical protein FOMPIDRAFT_87899 [Fomitopsis schrenkii]|uniref:DRBM domain-containing protein n=1 Tax=Fomitopsis schrenkii TaxID=2126942 RepID=S8EJI2_FOMSC|nr:hypothetical protein FOMPIDRAFT_87899 [Fomitopsis schrenkii]
MANEGTSALNNYLQSTEKANLLSWDESTSGPRHEPTWTCICKIDGNEYGRGTGPTKQLARNAAASVALERLMQVAAASQSEIAAGDDNDVPGE